MHLYFNVSKEVNIVMHIVNVRITCMLTSFILPTPVLNVLLNGLTLVDKGQIETVFV